MIEPSDRCASTPFHGLKASTSSAQTRRASEKLSCSGKVMVPTTSKGEAASSHSIAASSTGIASRSVFSARAGGS